MIHTSNKPIATIATSYDRAARSWAVQLKDNHGHKVGEALLCGERTNAAKVIREKAAAHPHATIDVPFNHLKA